MYYIFDSAYELTRVDSFIDLILIPATYVSDVKFLGKKYMITFIAAKKKVVHNYLSNHKYLDGSMVAKTLTNSMWPKLMHETKQNKKEIYTQLVH